MCSIQVFWIVVGTGSVQLLSYKSVTATSEPSSTAKASVPQYGRKLLQSVTNATTSNSTGNGTIPAEQATFAVTLPSATQNSLLVLQSASPTVRQQFAGWFVTQMQARGTSAILPLCPLAPAAVWSARRWFCISQSPWVPLTVNLSISGLERRIPLLLAVL